MTLMLGHVGFEPPGFSLLATRVLRPCLLLFGQACFSLLVASRVRVAYGQQTITLPTHSPPTSFCDPRKFLLSRSALNEEVDDLRSARRHDWTVTAYVFPQRRSRPW